MNKVDYLKLAEQYANFLVAVGGVSITALTLVLSLSGKSKDRMRPAEGVSRAFLVAALSVSTVCCFIGAQMMAETAAFISYSQEAHLGLSGERPFLLASTNIFMAAVLVLFALMLLPTVSGEKQAASLATISVAVFVLIVIGAICWMGRAATSRMPAPSSWPAIRWAVTISILWGLLLFFFIKAKYFLIKAKKYIPRKACRPFTRKRIRPFTRKLIRFIRKRVYDEKVRHQYLLIATFIPIIFFAVISLLWFAWTFGEGGQAQDIEIFFFTLAVTFSYSSLIISSIKIMGANRAEALERRKTKLQHDYSSHPPLW